jgi:NAD(P)-dependent dehydrogenase (short-subunit alcohol dehydrogenase family)
MNGRGRVIVTGASTGIGEATALHLRELGFSVLAGVRRDEDAERLREQGLTPIRLDVTVQNNYRSRGPRSAINRWPGWSTTLESPAAGHWSSCRLTICASRWK